MRQTKYSIYFITKLQKFKKVVRYMNLMYKKGKKGEYRLIVEHISKSP